MRTTIDLQEDLLAEAMKAPDIHTKTGVIICCFGRIDDKIKDFGVKET